MDQALAAASAGFCQRGRGQVVHALVGLATARPQDADAIHHHIDAVEHRLPGLGGQQILEVNAAAQAAAGFPRQAPIQAPGMPAAYFHREALGEQRRHGVAANETAAAEDQYAQGGRIGIPAGVHAAPLFRQSFLS